VVGGGPLVAVAVTAVLLALDGGVRLRESDRPATTSVTVARATIAAVCSRFRFPSFFISISPAVPSSRE